MKCNPVFSNKSKMAMYFDVPMVVRNRENKDFSVKLLETGRRMVFVGFSGTAER